MSLTANQVTKILFKTPNPKFKHKLPKHNSKWVPPKPKPKPKPKEEIPTFSLFTFKITEQWNI